MRKLVCTFIAVMYLGFACSQNDVVVYEYEVNYNLGKALYKTGYLLELDESVRYNTTKSNYIKDFKKFAIDQETSRPTINFMAAGDGSEHLVLLKKADSIHSSRSLGNEVLTITEIRPTQNWKPTGNNKVINGYDCVELRTEFRGRVYNAYVNLSIPFRYGPWKFSNLPGLAIKIADTENKLSWTLKKISKRDIESINKFIANQDNYLETLRQVSLKEYVELYDNTNGGSNVLFSKLPREYKRDKSSASQFKRGGFELKYEWEEQ